MGEALVINDKRHTALEVQPSLSPMQELQMQMVRSGDVEKLKELRAIEKEWREDQAKHAFVEAMAAFKAESIRVVKDKTNNQYNSKYVSLGNLVATVTPLLSNHGLSARWDIDQSSGIKVTCIVTHALGHSESVSMTCPPDKSGAKNPIQEIKSAITYAKACTFESICGIASTDANLDDDGNGTSGSKPSMPEEIVLEWIDKIKESSSDAELKKNYFDAMEAAKKLGDSKAMKAFSNAKNETWRRIHGGAK